MRKRLNLRDVASVCTTWFVVVPLGVSPFCLPSRSELFVLGFSVQGGYFIISGTEKVIVAQENMAANHVYVFKKVVFFFFVPFLLRWFRVRAF